MYPEANGGAGQTYKFTSTGSGTVSFEGALLKLQMKWHKAEDVVWPGPGPQHFVSSGDSVIYYRNLSKQESNRFHDFNRTIQSTR